MERSLQRPCPFLPRVGHEDLVDIAQLLQDPDVLRSPVTTAEDAYAHSSALTKR
jgi:hypothetical protein